MFVKAAGSDGETEKRLHRPLKSAHFSQGEQGRLNRGGLPTDGRGQTILPEIQSETLPKVALLSKIEYYRKVTSYPSFYIAWGDFLEEQHVDSEMAESKYRKAIAIARKVASMNGTFEEPDAARAYVAWGQLLEKQGKYHKAIEKYVASLFTAPDNPMGYIKQAIVESKVKNYKRADQLFEKGAALDPQSIDLWLAWGDYYCKLGKWASAAEKYEEAVRLNPSNRKNAAKLARAKMKTCK